MDALTDPSMLASLTTEQRNPWSTHIDTLPTLGMLELINAEDAKVAEAVRRELPQVARAVDAISERMLHHGGRLMYIGAGTSGRLGILDASECPPTYKTTPDQVMGFMAGGDTAIRKAVEGVEDSLEAGRADVISNNITPHDTLVGLAASGRTPYVIGAIRYAKSIGALTVGVACNKQTHLSREVDIMIDPVSGPEVVTGSTRMKAGTATKLVLNMLSTGAMIRYGKTFGNLMVDLQCSNYKLELRAVRIVQMALEDEIVVKEQDADGRIHKRVMTLTKERAETLLLSECNGEVKTAILVGKTGMDAMTARQCLSEANGVLAKALDRFHTAANGHTTDSESENQPHTFLNADSSSKQDQLYLCIDGGGTKTFAVIVNDLGQEIGRGASGSSNYSVVGLKATLEAIQTAVEHALEGHQSQPGSPDTQAVSFNVHHPLNDQELAQSRPQFPAFTKIWVGLAGSDRSLDRSVLLPALSTFFGPETPSQNILLTSDADLLASRFITSKQAGIVLIGGTGSIALAYDSTGQRIRRVGGWGYILGDEGSGYALGLAACRQLAMVLDGRKPLKNGKTPIVMSDLPPFYRAIMEDLGCEKPDHFVPLIYAQGQSDAERKTKLAKLAETVLDAADRNDEDAQAIIQEGSVHLADLVIALIHQEFLSTDRLPLVVAGGPLCNHLAYRQMVLDQIRSQIGDRILEVVVADIPAVVAAQDLASVSVREQYHIDS